MRSVLQQHRRHRRRHTYVFVVIRNNSFIKILYLFSHLFILRTNGVVRWRRLHEITDVRFINLWTCIAIPLPMRTCPGYTLCVCVCVIRCQRQRQRQPSNAMSRPAPLHYSHCCAKHARNPIQSDNFEDKLRSIGSRRWVVATKIWCVNWFALMLLVSCKQTHRFVYRGQRRQRQTSMPKKKPKKNFSFVDDIIGPDHASMSMRNSYDLTWKRSGNRMDPWFTKIHALVRYHFHVFAQVQNLDADSSIRLTNRSIQMRGAHKLIGGNTIYGMQMYKQYLYIHMLKFKETNSVCVSFSSVPLALPPSDNRRIRMCNIRFIFFFCCLSHFDRIGEKSLAASLAGCFAFVSRTKLPAVNSYR